MKRRCPRCKTEKPLDEFYRRRDDKNASVYCKPCTNAQTIERQQRLKLQAIAYKGSKCQKCGYAGYIGAFDFHHRDPLVKDFSLSHAKLTSFEKVKPELDKCDLLCANCHREEHARLKGLY